MMQQHAFDNYLRTYMNFGVVAAAVCLDMLLFAVAAVRWSMLLFAVAVWLRMLPLAVEVEASNTRLADFETE